MPYESNGCPGPDMTHCHIKGPGLKIQLRDRGEVIGVVSELTPPDAGAVQTSVAYVELYAPDVLHHHITTEEHYCFETPAQMYLNGETVDVSSGDRMIIRPGTVHGARPVPSLCDTVKFICVSGPAYSPKDVVFLDDRPEEWYG